MDIINKLEFNDKCDAGKPCPPVDCPARTNMSDRCALAKARGVFGGSFIVSGIIGIVVIISLHVLSAMFNLIAIMVLAMMFLSGIYAVVLFVSAILVGIGGYLKYQERDDCTAAEFYATR
jgi:hypothetical protein